MRRTGPWIALAVLLASPGLRADPPPIVVVFNVEGVGYAPGADTLEALSVFLSGRLAASRQFQVVPRDQLKARLTEQKKSSYQECYDQSCQIELGRELAAQKTIAAQVVRVGKTCTVTLNVFDLARAASEGGASVKGTCDDDGVLAALETAADQLATQAAGVPAPVVRTGPATPGGKPAAWVRVPAGEFRMGSPPDEKGRDADEGPQHLVRITRALLVKATEVTQREWRELFGNNPSRHSDCGDDCPVESVKWWEAAAYCNALSRKEGLPECWELTGCDAAPGERMDCRGARFRGLDCPGYRLPTEAEWEYAARAGTTGARYGDLDAIAWWNGNSGGRPHPVGQKQPNAWGLYDAIGNVWEWTADWKGPYPSETVADPTGPADGSTKVFRGNSFRAGWVVAGMPQHQRAAVRDHFRPGGREPFVGFRCVRTVAP